MKRQSSERGQAIILIVFAIIGMMGFAAMAVDLGHVYSERRRAQNAADAAAYAAAFQAVSGANQAKIIEAGINSAIANGFTSDGASTIVEVNRPPVSGTYKDEEDYIQVLITQHVEMHFARVFYGGEEYLTVEAVAYAPDATSVSAGNVLHATKADGIGIEIDGSVNLHIKGGNLYARDDVVKNGNGNVTISGGRVLYSGSNSKPWSNLTSDLDPPIKQVPPIDISPLPEPACPANKISSIPASGILEPGTYTVLIEIINKDSQLTMKPGIYCLEKGIKSNGGLLTGRDVLIVLTKGASITGNGNGALNLTRASDITDANGNQWGGMLIYNAGGGSISLLGTNNSHFSGTVYAPNSMCEVGGNNNTIGYESNFICNWFKFHGKYFVVDYKAPMNYQLPPMISLVE